jgi:hypothetical protein
MKTKSFNCPLLAIIFLITSIFNSCKKDNAPPDPDNSLPNNGLIAYYPLNSNANDASGMGNNGVIFGGVTSTTDRFGNDGKAMLFNGVDGYIEVPNSISLQSPTNALSITGWVLIEGYNGLQVVGIVNKTKTSDYGQYGLSYQAWDSQNKISFYMNQGNIGSSKEFSLNLSQWYFIASVFSGNNIAIFVNGVHLGNTPYSGSIISDDKPITLGLDSPGSKEYLKGKLDDVRIYNTSLTESEIIKLYNE